MILIPLALKFLTVPPPRAAARSGPSGAVAGDRHGDLAPGAARDRSRALAGGPPRVARPRVCAGGAPSLPTGSHGVGRDRHARGGSVRRTGPSSRSHWPSGWLRHASIENVRRQRPRSSWRRCSSHTQYGRATTPARPFPWSNASSTSLTTGVVPVLPGGGVGLHSSALAFCGHSRSASAWSASGRPGGRLARSSATTPPIAGLDRRRGVAAALAMGALVVLVNLPLIVTEVGYSARTFTPTWLVVSGAVALIGARVSSRRTRVLAASAALRRLRASVPRAERFGQRPNRWFDEAAAQWIADRTRTVTWSRSVTSAGRWSTLHRSAPSTFTPCITPSGEWIEYFTGRVVDFRRSGPRYWGARCPAWPGPISWCASRNWSRTSAEALMLEGSGVVRTTREVTPTRAGADARRSKP